MTFTAQLDQNFVPVGQLAPLFLTLSTDTPGSYALDVVVFDPAWNEVARFAVAPLSLSATPTQYRLADWAVPYAEATATHPVRVVFYTADRSLLLSTQDVTAGPGRTALYVASRSSVPEPADPDHPPVEHGRNMPPGTAPLTSAQAALVVERDPFWEPRPGNVTANNTVPSLGGVVNVNGASSTWNTANAPKIDGNFKGTTDEIIRWGAAKWGFTPDLVRARADKESGWDQTLHGDIGAGESYGLLQIKSSVHTGTYPYSSQSTAFNVDYALAWIRACYDGAMTWLNNPPNNPDPVTNPYPGPNGTIAERAKRLQGAVRAWYSGNWFDAGSQSYWDDTVRRMLLKRWFDPGF